MNLEALKARMKVVSDPRYRDFYFQRMVTDVPKRERRAARAAAALPEFDATAAGPVADRAAALGRDGFVMLDGVVDAADIERMRGYFSTHACSDPYRPQLGSFIAPAEAPKGTHVAFFDNDVVSQAPLAFEIANRPQTLAVVARTLGAKPTISYMTAWWSVPSGDGTAQHAEKYHRDVDDWRFIKMFLYLTDVDDGAGPHKFVKGSHKVNQLTDIRRFDDEEVRRTFGPENEIQFTGPAGTCFLENTYGVHRGVPPTDKPRLIFQVLYSLRPVIYGPKAPVSRLGASGLPQGLDPYINRIYLAS